MKSSAGYYLEADCFDLIRISGPDAARFLQGQLTCDVNALEPESSTFGAVCTNKGRVVATFTICRIKEEFVMMLAKGLAEPLLAHLAKFLPFYKCSMIRVDGTLTGLSFSAGHESGVPLPPDQKMQILAPESGWICSIPGAGTRVIHYGHPGESSPWLQEAISGLSPAPCSAWMIEDMQAGIFPFTPLDIDRYTPQELHLDRSGFINFNKGCYTGQEIVARMHYKSKPKKQLYLLTIANCPAGTLPDGFGVFSSDDQEVGTALRMIEAEQDTVFAIVQLPVLAEAGATTLKTGSGHQIRPRVLV